MFISFKNISRQFNVVAYSLLGLGIFSYAETRAQDSAAVKSFHDLKPFAKTAYSKTLDSLQDAINKELPLRKTAHFKRVAVMDPYVFDLGRALGMKNEDIAREMLKDYLSPDDSLTAKTVATLMSRPVYSRYNDDTAVPDPHIVKSSGGAPYAVLIPSSNIRAATQAGNLSRDEDIAYSNLHEAWHCLDTAFRCVPKVRTTLQSHQSEVFADVAAAGDMVRGGHRVGVIRDIINYRKKDMEDITRLSMFALEILRDTIEHIGLKKFRAMDRKSAERLYIGVARAGMFDQEKIDLYTTYLFSEDTERERILMHEHSGPNEKFLSSLARYINETDNAAPTPDEDYRRQDSVMSKWSGVADMFKNATDSKGSINKRTLTIAYTKAQNDLDLQIRKAPHNTKTHQAQMMKLRARYVSTLKSLNDR